MLYAPEFIMAKRPSGQAIYVNIKEIKAFKVNPMDESQCIIYLDAEDINLNAFGPQTDSDESGFTTNVFYVDKETLFELIDYYPVPNNENDEEEIGEPLTDEDDFENPNEDIDADDESVGVTLTDDDTDFEEPNEE